MAHIRTLPDLPAVFLWNGEEIEIISPEDLWKMPKEVAFEPVSTMYRQWVEWTVYAPVTSILVT